MLEYAPGVEVEVEFGFGNDKAWVEVHRVAGDKLIVPSDRDMSVIAQHGSPRIVGSFKICMDEAGAVAKVTMLKSTRLRGYDDRIQKTIQRGGSMGDSRINRPAQITHSSGANLPRKQ